MAKKQKLPPVHPGEVLREDYLIPAGMTVNALALALRVPVSRMYEIVNCERAITPESALRLASYLGASAEGLKLRGRWCSHPRLCCWMSLSRESTR